MGHKVTVRPAGLVVDVEPDEVIMAAANRQGIYWPTGCEGEGVCTRCYLEVDDDAADALTPMHQVELNGLRKVRWRIRDVPGERLACQVRVSRDIEVTKKFVRRARDGDILPFASEDG